MTNNEYIRDLDFEIRDRITRLKLQPDDTGHYLLEKLLISIITKKFREEYPGSLDADDVTRVENWYSWYIIYTNSIAFYNHKTTVQKLAVAEDLLAAKDVVLWCFNNLKYQQ